MNGIYFLCKEQEQLYLRKSCGWRSRKYRWKEMNPSVNCINCRRQGWEWLHRGRGGCGEAPLPLAGVHRQGGDQEADVWRLPGQQQTRAHRGTLLRRHLNWTRAFSQKSSWCVHSYPSHSISHSTWSWFPHSAHHRESTASRYLAARISSSRSSSLYCRSIATLNPPYILLSRQCPGQAWTQKCWSPCPELMRGLSSGLL